MARPSTVESRLAAIEAILTRANEDRVDMNRKMDAHTVKFEALDSKLDMTTGEVRQLTQKIESGARAMEDMAREAKKDDCGNRLKSIEGWMQSVDGRLKKLETRESRLEDCERGVKEFRAMKKGFWGGVWQIALAAIGGGGAVKLLDRFWH